MPEIVAGDTLIEKYKRQPASVDRAVTSLLGDTAEAGRIFDLLNDASVQGDNAQAFIEVWASGSLKRDPDRGETEIVTKIPIFVGSLPDTADMTMKYEYKRSEAGNRGFEFVLTGLGFSRSHGLSLTDTHTLEPRLGHALQVYMEVRVPVVYYTYYDNGRPTEAGNWRPEFEKLDTLSEGKAEYTAPLKFGNRWPPPRNTRDITTADLFKRTWTASRGSKFGVEVKASEILEMHWSVEFVNETTVALEGLLPPRHVYTPHFLNGVPGIGWKVDN